MIIKQEEQEDKDKEEKSPRVSTQQKTHKTPSLVYSTPENDLRKTVKSEFTANT